MQAFKNLTKRNYIALAVALVAGFGIVFALTALSKGSQVGSQTQCDGTCVALTSTGAKPDTITVPLNSAVQFNSADGKSHNLSLGEGGDEHKHTGKFYSGEFKADEAWRVEFNEEGSFLFHDHLNPKISVLVVVYEPGKEYKIE